MPNGFHGSPGDWQRMSEPLLALDPALEAFCQEHGLSLEKNSRGWPCRRITWTDEVARLIEIFLADQEQLVWTMWVCAWKDRFGARLVRRTAIVERTTAAMLQAELPRLLRESFMVVSVWKEGDLEVSR
jgi:hypothetical protein